MDLLTTYTHDWELQAITAPPLSSTIHKSPQHPISLFQSDVFISSSQQRVLTAILQLHVLRSSPHSLPCRTDSQLSLSHAYNISARTLRKHSSSIVASNCCIIKNLLPSNGNVFTEPLPRNGRCLQSHCIATGLYVTIHRHIFIYILTYIHIKAVP
jgi:hypothetical protein